LPGTATADYRAILAQLDSQRFLEAYNSLRGGGAISNYEDKRASDAKARLSTAQSPQAFNDALREYREIVQSGVHRMRTLAGKSAAPETASEKPDPLGLR
jgi:maltooligosyltrehalose synthase